MFGEVAVADRDIQRQVADAMRRLGCRDVRIVNLSMQDIYIRANYQDFQRYQPVDLHINGDAQGSLAALTEEVRKLSGDDRKRAVYFGRARIRRPSRG